MGSKFVINYLRQKWCDLQSLFVAPRLGCACAQPHAQPSCGLALYLLVLVDDGMRSWRALISHVFAVSDICHVLLWTSAQYPHPPPSRVTCSSGPRLCGWRTISGELFWRWEWTPCNYDLAACAEVFLPEWWNQTRLGRTRLQQQQHRPLDKSYCYIYSVCLPEFNAANFYKANISTCWEPDG